MVAYRNETFGLIKTRVDAHTMGINTAAALLRDCGYRVVISPPKIEAAIECISSDSCQKIILDWLENNSVNHVGFSYRLDPDDAVDILGRFVYLVRNNGLYGNSEASIRSIFFAGLKQACDIIDREYEGEIRTFRGGESSEESLFVMGIPLEDIPSNIKEGCKYDKELEKFGEGVIKCGEYRNMKAPFRKIYNEFGSTKDTLLLRLKNRSEEGYPIIRAHSGPYSEDRGRLSCLQEYHKWCRELGKEGLLDVLSIGTSQLSQSNFGENWNGKLNGGGVPVNSEAEYHDIWMAARPMLVRTYSGTKDLIRLARIYERSINISWHALSLWWFDELDGRGPNTLYENIKEHLETIRYISTTGKPVETNVPHHFAFRGADDVTYIVSGYLAAKASKKFGTKTFVLQNMLNTPRSTWGIQDIAKSRTLIKLVKELEDENFRVVLETRAGLDYFKPNIDSAQKQLAAVTALMDDIIPDNAFSPEIIHVVSYSEALFLATPDVINDSIRITLTALRDYRQLKKKGLTPDVHMDIIRSREYLLENACRRIIREMENAIYDLYSPTGLYLAFVGGWLPTPELWSDSEEFKLAKAWQTRMTDGGVALCDRDVPLSVDARISKCRNNMDEAFRIMKYRGINI